MATVEKQFIAQGIRQAYAKDIKTCPVATVDIHVNLKNRNNAIKEYGYGPLNPESESREFWDKKAALWNTTVKETQKSRCGNCSAFIQTPGMLKCIKDGIRGDEPADESYAEDVARSANLGFCELFDFKCAADRTCDAWLVGGPIK